MRQIRALALIALSGGAVAIGIWLLPASIHIVSWRHERPGLIALVAPIGRLWLSLAAVGIVLVASCATSRYRDVPLERVASALAPLLLIYSWALPFVPGMAAPFPILLILAGPIRWGVAALALGGSLWQFARQRGWCMGIAGQPASRHLFAVTFLVYVALGWHVTKATGPLGDEPHYLVLTHSLLVDHDIQIGNNFEDRDYRAFYPGPLKPHLATPGAHGEVYMIHSPGAPALLLPGYALAGYHGATITMALIAALAVLVQFRLAAEVAGQRAALLTWIAVAFTIPFAPFSWMIYPEMPAALVAALAALWLWIPVPTKATTWFLRGMALAVYPWLHIKFTPLMLCLAACLTIRLWPRVRLALALSIPMLISVLLWMSWFYAMYGSFSPFTPYGSPNLNSGMPFHVDDMARATLGLLFDRSFGVLLYSPVFVLAPAGWWRMVRHRRSRWYCVGLTVAVIVFVLSLTTTFMWWGGASAPGRFLVPAVPLVAAMVAASIGDLRHPAWRSLAGLALTMSVGSLLAMVLRPSMHLLFNGRGSTGRLVEALQGDGPLSLALPSFVGAEWWAELPRLGAWLTAAGLAVLAARLVSPYLSRRTAGVVFWVPVSALLTFVGVEGVLGSLVLADSARREAERVGRTRLLERYDPPRLAAFDPAAWRRLDSSDLLRRSAISIDTPWPADGESPADRGETQMLPAGSYEARVWFSGGAQRDGELLVVDRRTREPLARSRGMLDNPAGLSFSVDHARSNVTIFVRGARLASEVVRLDIEPRSIVPRSARAGAAP